MTTTRKYKVGDDNKICAKFMLTSVFFLVAL